MAAPAAGRMAHTRRLLQHRLFLNHGFSPRSCSPSPPPSFEQSNLPCFLPRFSNRLSRQQSSGSGFGRISASSFVAKRRQWCSSSTSAAAVGKEEITAMQMIEYARSLKGDDASYAEATRVLEQGLSFFTGDGLFSANAAGRVRLTLASIHANRSNPGAAVDVLQQLIDTASASLEMKVAALEALTGLFLQTHQDDAACGHAERCLQFVKTGSPGLGMDQLQNLEFRAEALRRLVKLVHAHVDVAEAFSNASAPLPSEAASGAAVLAKAEVLHVQGNLPLAKELYEKAIHLAKIGVETPGQVLSAITAVPEQVHIGALAGLGQLLTILGSYDEAEEKLAEALKQAEHIKGKDNFQVGVILTCVGDLYWQRGRTSGSSDALLTEGLYRSALDLLKAPPLDQEDSGKFLELNEIVTLTRARLGVNLAPISSRRSEAVRLKIWAGAAWKNSQPLPELLLLTELLSEKETEKSETTVPVTANNMQEKKHTLIDVRLGRVLL